MATITGPITPDGALVTLAIGVSEARRQLLQRMNFPIPQPCQVCAILDPGSQVTVAEERGLQRLQVTSLGQFPLMSSSSGLASNLLNVFLLSVTLLDAGGQAVMYWPQVKVYGTSYHPMDTVRG